jgi:hypothetical protein
MLALTIASGGGMVAFLAPEDAGCVTGDTIHVDAVKALSFGICTRRQSARCMQCSTRAAWSTAEVDGVTR